MTMPSMRRIGRVLETICESETGGVERGLRDRESCEVTSGTAAVDGPFDTVRVTVDPFEPAEPPLGVLVGDDPGRLVGVLVDAGDAEAGSLEL